MVGRAASGGAALFTPTRAVASPQYVGRNFSSGDTMSEQPPRRRPSPLAVKLIAAFAVLAALYWGRTLIVPVLIGVLVSYALNPIVETLTRWRLPRTLASMLVVLGVLGLAATLTYQLSDETQAAIRGLPAVSKRLRTTVEQAVGRRNNVVQELQTAADSISKAAEGETARRRAGEPMPVAIIEPTIDVRQYLWMGWWGLLGMTGQALLIVFLSFFMLSSGDLYRRKFVRLAGASLSSRRVTVDILDEIGSQISLFLIHQVLTGILVGVATWLAFMWLGVEYAALWGVAAGVMNSIPYFGPTVVAIAAFVVSFIQFNSAWQASMVSMASLAITTVEGMLITPLLVSRLASMNPVAVFLGLLFWGWLWGVVGMLLAVPLMMVVKAVADRVDDLKPLAELLGE
jgi:predicted PurR-regulated permease PerM